MSILLPRHVRTLLLAVSATVLGLLPVLPAFALDPSKGLADCTLAVWRVRDGLPGGWVRAIAQDDDGYLWVGTYGGLARYDGDKMTVLPSQARMRRLSDVATLHQGRSGTLWAIPSFGPPVCLHGTLQVNCLPDRAGIAENARIEAALFDSDDDLWIGTRVELVHVVGGQARLVLRHDQTPWRRVETMIRDRRGRLWLGTDVGLFIEDGGHFVRAPHTEAITTGIFAFTVDRVGVLWAGGQGGLVRVSPDDQVTVFDARNGLPDARIETLLEDRDGSLWIGTQAGLVRHRGERFTVFGIADGLPDAEISTLFEDREGGLWVGMRAGGLAQFTDRTIDTKQGPSVLIGQAVETVAQDEAGALWVGWRNGLIRWKDGAARTWTAADGLASSHVLTALPDGPGVVWVGTVHGLQRMHDGQIDPPLFSDGPGVALASDRRGGLWFGSAGRVGHLGKDAQITWIPADSDAVLEQVRAIEEDDRGEVWVSGIGGIDRLHDGHLVRLRSADGQVIPSPRSVHREADGTLWFGTSGGLLRLRHGRFHLYGAAQGLLAEQIHQVLTDQRGYVWLGTSRGVFRISESELDEIDAGKRHQTSPVWFDTSDERRDLAVTNVRQPGAWRALDGRLWFASDHGLITLDPRAPHINPLPPTLVIEEAVADGRRLREGPGAPAGGHRSLEHDLTPGPGNFDFAFAVITLIEPRKARVRYKLEGFESDWVEAGGRRTAHYTNIAPGRYRFRVVGANADGVWNEIGDTVSLRLRPHFYRTPWFYGMGAILLASLGYLVYRERLARLRREYLAAFAERGRVARELHDTLLQSLSAVGMHLRAVRRRLEGTAAPSARELEGIENMVSLSLEETRRFVWNLREQPIGSGDLGLALQRLAARLTDGHEVAPHVTVDGAVVALPNTAQGELFRIAQEAITNALKHAKAARIDVRLCYEGSTVRMIVSDDGRGFDPERAEGPETGHFGLLGMRERAGRLGGVLSIDSQPGRGTVLTVTVDLKRQEVLHG